MQAHIAAERRAQRTQETIEAIDAHEQAIASAVGAMVDDLCERGVIRIHREWSASTERKLIREAATRVAVRAVLTSDWVTELPSEARWLFLEREP